MIDHLCDYRDPLSADEPHKRRCCVCGEPQVYRAPVSQGEFPYIMMVRKDDLRRMLAHVEDAVGEHCDPDGADTAIRVRALLD